MLRNVYQHRNGMYYAAIHCTYTDSYTQWELHTGTDENNSSILQVALKSVVNHKCSRADTMSGMAQSVVPWITGMHCPI